jgi:nucleoside-diphosphate-sugar epimerase
VAVTPTRILLTGASGAVGHCVVRELLATTDAELVLLVRPTSTLDDAVSRHPRVTRCVGDVAEGATLGVRLPPIDRAVLLATSWGPDAESVNVDGTLALVAALRARGTAQVVWFGTASIVRSDGSPDPAALSEGTPYVRSKALCHARLRELPTQGLTIVHPTLVVAGDAHAPASHLTRLLGEVERRAWLAQWIRGEGSCHMVHAEDLARLVRQLVTREPRDAPGELIAGAPATTLDELLALLLERGGRRRRQAIDLTPARVEWLIRAFSIELSAWDRRCLTARHFTYREACLTLVPTEAPRYATTRAIIATVPPPHP